MMKSHLRKIATLAAILAILLAACGPQETETPEPTDVPVEQATEVPTEVPTEVEETEVADADSEAADDEDTEATEEADMDDEDMEATEEADMDDEDMEATEEADMDDEDMEATEEADMDDEDMEATEEADMDDEDMEATEEADMDDEDMEATEEADMDDVAVVTYDDEAGFTFDYPEGYEVTTSNNAITLDMGEQRLIVISPAGWTAVVVAPTDDNLANLTFLAERLGYTAGDEADMSMADASINIELPRRGLVGYANLVDLGEGNYSVVIELGPDADSIPSADGAVISGSVAYAPPPPPEEEAPVEEEAAEPSLTIIGIALQTENLDTLTTAILRSGYLTTLNGEGPYTVFAPTDDAFAAALETLDMTAEELLDDEELLASVLTYHVIDGTLLSSDLEDGMEVETLNGAILTIGVSEDGVTVTDGTGASYNVVAADVLASNGVVHVIDGVLLPPSE